VHDFDRFGYSAPGGALYRIRSYGTARMKLLQYSAGNFVIDRGLIYFLNEKYDLKKTLRNKLPQAG